MGEKAEAFTSVLFLVNWVKSGKTPPLPMDRLIELGFRLDIFPVSRLLVATHSIQKILDHKLLPVGSS